MPPISSALSPKIVVPTLKKPGLHQLLLGVRRLSVQLSGRNPRDKRLDVRANLQEPLDFHRQIWRCPLQNPSTDPRTLLPTAQLHGWTLRFKNCQVANCQTSGHKWLSCTHKGLEQPGLLSHFPIRYRIIVQLSHYIPLSHYSSIILPLLSHYIPIGNLYKSQLFLVHSHEITPFFLSQLKIPQHPSSIALLSLLNHIKPH